MTPSNGGGFPEVARKDVTNALLKGLTKDPRVHTNKIGCRAFYALVQHICAMPRYLYPMKRGIPNWSAMPIPGGILVAVGRLLS
jgi:hypothetical protein